MTVDDALALYLVQLRADGRSAHTVGQYRRHVGLLARWLAQGRARPRRLTQIDHETLALFLAAPEATRSAHGGQKLATSLNALRSSLRTFFGYLHRAGYVRQDPARLIRGAHC